MNKIQAKSLLAKYEVPELFGCPFCDDSENPPILYFNDKKHFNEVNFVVTCTNCGCEPDFCVETPEEAVLHWNTRKALKESQELRLGVTLARKYFIKILTNEEPELPS